MEANWLYGPDLRFGGNVHYNVVPSRKKMNSEEYRKKYKHFRMVYVSDDGFWIDGREVLRRLGVTNYPRMYVVPVLEPPETPVDGDLTNVKIINRVYMPYKLRSSEPISNLMVERLIADGKHKPEDA